LLHFFGLSVTGVFLKAKLFETLGAQQFLFLEHRAPLNAMVKI